MYTMDDATVPHGMQYHIKNWGRKNDYVWIIDKKSVATNY